VERLQSTLRKRQHGSKKGRSTHASFPLDTDNDLLIVNDSITPAVGEITHLNGRVLDLKGDPIKT